jgi:hypothetical protein
VDLSGNRLKWPGGYSLPNYNNTVNSEDPVYLVMPNPPFNGYRAKYDATVHRLNWENNFCFIIIFVDVVNVSFAKMKLDPYTVEFLGMPFWDRCMRLLYDKREGKSGLRTIAHHLRHIVPSYEAGDFGSIDNIEEALGKDLYGYRTLPRFLTDDGRIPSTTPKHFHLMEVSVKCEVCNVTRYFTSAYLVANVWTQEVLLQEIINPIENSYMSGGKGFNFGVGKVDTVGMGVVPTSRCRGPNGCNRKSTCHVTALQRPQLLLIFCLQTKKNSRIIKILRKVKVYPNPKDDGLYELTAVAFHEGNSHYVGISCLENNKFQYLDGFGGVYWRAKCRQSA